MKNNLKTRRACRRSLLNGLTAVVCLLSAWGCSDPASLFRIEPNPHQGYIGEATVEFNIDGMGELTRGATEARGQELKLNHVHIIFFSSLDDSYLTHVQSQVIEKGTERTFSFSIPRQVVPETEYKVLVVGNGNSFVPINPTTNTPYDTYNEYLDAICPGRTYSEVQNGLEFYSSQVMCSVGTPLLPMFGRLLDESRSEITFSYKTEGNKYIINGFFHFKRAVCRVDLKSFPVDKVHIQYVKLVNVPASTKVFKDGETPTEIIRNIDEEEPSDGVNGWVYVGGGDNTALDSSGNKYEFVEHSLYCFPNNQANTAWDDRHTTAIMIAGQYGSDAKYSYYRFNLTPSGEPLAMKRNHIYNGIIKGCKKRGPYYQDEAYALESPDMTAEVSEEWGAGTEVKTDGNGNFIMLSTTTLSMSGQKDLIQEIQVKVSPGSTWDIVVDAQTGNSNSKFEFRKIDDSTFYVKTLEENTEYSLRLGYLRIIAHTPEGNDIEVPFIVQQVPNEEDDIKLTVDGQIFNPDWMVPDTPMYMGNLKEMSSDGGRVELMVETGSLVQGWKVTECDEKGNPIDVDASKKHALLTDMNGGYGYFSNCGGDKGRIIIDMNPNTTKYVRDVYLKVERLFPPNISESLKGTVKPYIIWIKQPNKEILMKLFPDPEFNGNTIILEGFEPETVANNITLHNGISAQYEMFVSLEDPDRYRYEVTTTFDMNRDLVVTKDARKPRNFQAKHTGSGTTPTRILQDATQTEVKNMTTGQKFYINVFATGPGDPDIYGWINVTAKPQANLLAEGEKIEDYKEQTRQFEVIIKTNCKIDDAIVPYGSGKYLLVADRDCGAIGRINGTGGFQEALNYSANPWVTITNSKSSTGSTLLHDIDNANFKGNLYKYTESIDHQGARLNNGNSNYPAYPADPTWSLVWSNSKLLKGEDSSDPLKVFKEFFNTDPKFKDDISNRIDAVKSTSPFYTVDERGWRVPTNNEWVSYLSKYLRWSKNRCYILSCEKYKKDGADEYVGCYLPIYDNSLKGTRYLTSSKWYENKRINCYYNSSLRHSYWGLGGTGSSQRSMRFDMIYAFTIYDYQSNKTYTNITYNSEDRNAPTGVNSALFNQDFYVRLVHDLTAAEKEEYVSGYLRN